MNAPYITTPGWDKKPLTMLCTATAKSTGQRCTNFVSWQPRAEGYKLCAVHGKGGPSSPTVVATQYCES